MAKKKRRLTYGMHCKDCNRFNGTIIMAAKAEYDLEGDMKYCPGGSCRSHKPHTRKRIPKPN